MAAANPSSIADQVQQLRQQNAALQEQLQRQQRTSENRGRRVEQLQTTAVSDRSAPAKREVADVESSAAALTKAIMGRIHLGGDGAVAFFTSQSPGAFAKSDFRVDEARLLLEAPLWNEVYVFSELLVHQREEPGRSLRAGEF